MATSCITNSIIIYPNQSFVLPPGAEIVGASDINSIESECADLTNVETFQAFTIILASHERVGEGTQYFEKDTQEIDSILYNGVRIDIPNINNGHSYFGTFDTQNLLNTLQSNIQGITGGCVGTLVQPINDGNPQNSHSYVTIKTIPSIANNIKIVINVTAPMGSGNPGNVNNYTKGFEPRANLVAEGYINLPNC